LNIFGRVYIQTEKYIRQGETREETRGERDRGRSDYFMKMTTSTNPKGMLTEAKETGRKKMNARTGSINYDMINIIRSHFLLFMSMVMLLRWFPVVTLYETPVKLDKCS